MEKSNKMRTKRNPLERNMKVIGTLKKSSLSGTEEFQASLDWLGKRWVTGSGTV